MKEYKNYDFEDYNKFSYSFVKISKPSGRINTTKKSRPKGHQSSIRKGGK